MKQPIFERFWQRVKVTEKCWVWVRHTDPCGYGKFAVKGKYIGAHRMAYSLAIGPIPKGKSVLHHCDNPSCVRPSHLFLGSQADNMRDMALKSIGNHPNYFNFSGDKSTTAKLKKETVRKIRTIYASGMVTRRELASKYGIGVTAIHKIINRQSWKHL